MLKAIAVDDEPIALEVIRSLSQAVPFLQLEAVFTNAFDALEYLKKHPVELLFLDIRMPDISGLDLLRSLRKAPLTIFTTAYSEHAVKGFELEAVDYLLKPFSQARFTLACQRAYDRNQLLGLARSEPASLLVKSGFEQIKITVTDIRYLQSAGNYVSFVLESERVLSRLTLSEAEAMLPPGAFTRVHRSYVVANQYVRKIDRGHLYLGEQQIPIGPGYAQEAARIFS